MDGRKILNVFSVDLEDWFCVANMEKIFPPSGWDSLPGENVRIERSASAILDLLRDSGVRATFFVLGWIAERCPELVRKIYGDGHEIGIHGFSHRRITTIDRGLFEEDISRTLDAVSRIVPREEIAGYRAPSFSVVERTEWALDVIASFGLRFDSSVYPASGHPDYGWGGAPPNIHRLANGLVEIPMTPCFGGGYFRLFPYALSRALARRANRRGRPAIFYTHPWEIDAGQPRVELPPLKSFRHYTGLRRTKDKLKRLLSDFRFGSIGEALAENGF
jgi:polysaccharide deacetylase family protein (PEP-CTERM system associated)